MVSTKISLTMAALDDPAGMAQFLSGIPNGDRLGALLQAGHPLNSRAYDDDGEVARFVACDGRRVRCFAVAEVTIDQAEMIAAVGADLTLCTEAEFRDMVALALGPTL